MKRTSQCRLYRILSLLLAGLLVSGISTQAQAQVTPLDERLTMPRNRIAGDRGDWTTPILTNTDFAPIAGVTAGNKYTDCLCPTLLEVIEAIVTYSAVAFVLALIPGVAGCTSEL